MAYSRVLQMQYSSPNDGIFAWWLTSRRSQQSSCLNLLSLSDKDNGREDTPSTQIINGLRSCGNIQGPNVCVSSFTIQGMKVC